MLKNGRLLPMGAQIGLRKTSFHEFPLKQPELLQKWLVAMKRKNSREWSLSNHKIL